MVLRRIFGPKGDEVTGEWRRLHSEVHYDLYSSPNIIRVIKSRRMRGAEHVARMGDRIGANGILVGRPDGRRPLGRPTIILKWIFKKWDGEELTGFLWLRIWTGGCALVNAVMNFRVP
jgi:hypothetical protein